MIVCKNLSYSYSSNNKVLKNINFKLDTGKIGALLGVTGSGKTTLLKCIGKDIIDFKGNVKVSSNCRYVSDLPSLSERLTGIEYVDMLLSLGGNKTNELVNKVINSIGIRKDLNKKINEISFYTKKVLVLLSSICLDSDTILIDEPFKGLDRNSQLLIVELLKILNNEGKTILFSTDLLDYGYNIADELFLLNRGKILIQKNNFSSEKDYEKQVLNYLLN